MQTEVTPENQQDQPQVPKKHPIALYAVLSIALVITAVTLISRIGQVNALNSEAEALTAQHAEEIGRLSDTQTLITQLEHDLAQLESGKVDIASLDAQIREEQTRLTLAQNELRKLQGEIHRLESLDFSDDAIETLRQEKITYYQQRNTQIIEDANKTVKEKNPHGIIAYTTEQEAGFVDSAVQTIIDAAVSELFKIPDAVSILSEISSFSSKSEYFIECVAKRVNKQNSNVMNVLDNGRITEKNFPAFMREYLKLVEWYIMLRDASTAQFPSHEYENCRAELERLYREYLTNIEIIALLGGAV